MTEITDTAKADIARTVREQYPDLEEGDTISYDTGFRLGDNATQTATVIAISKFRKGSRIATAIGNVMHVTVKIPSGELYTVAVERP